MITQSQLEQYNRDGYFVASGLFSKAEVQQYIQHYLAMHDVETKKNHESLNDTSVKNPSDPLAKWPRMLQMHRSDELSLQWLTDPRLNALLTPLMGREPYAVQTMLYFKPPGARGQALHQDQFYLRVQPGTCMAAWMALDDCDEENGCITVVPGSHNWPLLCIVPADTTKSFTDVTVDLPEGQQAVPVHLKAGDVLFFNGTIVHGSGPNTSSDRFRRALIGHYIAGEAEQVYRWYKPVLRMDGSEVEIGESEIGGACGNWVTRDGQPELEMVAEVPASKIFDRH